MMKRIFSQMCCVATLGAVIASQTARAADSASAEYKPFTLGVEAGSTGVGGSLNWRFADHFGARAGVGFLSYSRSGDDIEGIKYNSKLRLLSEPLGLDIYPWASSSFRITVGALINENRLTGTSPSTGAGTFVEINGNQIDSGAVGDINMKIKQDTFSPFVALGINFYIDKAKHWSVGGELGVAYTGNPDVSLTRNGGADVLIDAQLEAERKQLEDKAKDFKFYPIIKIGVNFSF